MKRLKDIIEKLKEIRTETKSKVSDEILWDCSVRIYNCPIHSKKSKIIHATMKSKPATEKQKNLLKKFKIKFNDTITKEEAIGIINKEIEKRNTK